MRNICSPLQTVETQRKSRYGDQNPPFYKGMEGRLKKKRTDHRGRLKMGLITKDV